MKAGSLYHAFAFEKRTESSDGMGNTVSAWSTEFECRAGRMILKGGESIMAARLEGRQPVVLTVRNESRTRQIDTDWRARDLRTNAIYNVRSVQPSEKRDGIELLCEAGVAHG
jgi:head-tail adaptor